MEHTDAEWVSACLSLDVGLCVFHCEFHPPPQ